LSSAMDAFVSEKAVKWTYTLSAFGGSLLEVVHDGRKDGTANATLTIAGHIGQASMVLDGKVYLEGNARGLTEVDSFTASAAQKEAGKWIAVPRTSSYFAAYANDLTVASAVEELYLGGTMKAFPPKVINGRKVYAVQESLTTKGQTIIETVYIRAVGLPLPVEAVLSVDGVPGSIVYGPWGVPPDAKVPAKSVPFESSWVARA